MKKLSKLIDKLENWLIFAIPIVVFLSYYPVIRLGITDSMNLELSLPLLCLAALGLISIRRLPKVSKCLGYKKFLCLLILPSYITLSILWSPNKLRGILVAGIFWLLWLVALNILFGRKLKQKEIRKIIKLHLCAAVAISVFCLVQCVADVFGVGRDWTLLCQGCTYTTFGFPHPNGLAIEPQFMGNLLLCPCVLAICIFYHNISYNKNKNAILKSLLLTMFLNITLYMVFSRGALYAFVIAATGIMIYRIVCGDKIKTLIIPAVIVVAFGIALCLQGLLVIVSPTSEGFFEAIAKSVNQVSLGIIDFRPKEVKITQDKNKATFDGYIEESTNIRLSLSETAIEVWKTAPIFGVGIGGAGVAIHNMYDKYSAKEIVQNEYISILLELGIIGIAIVLGGLIWFFYYEKNLKNASILALLIAYLISLCFFSGLPNALHIYLLMPMLALSKDRYYMVKYNNEQVDRWSPAQRSKK